MPQEPTQTPTFGQKAVGLTFNPSGDEKVTKIKQLYADIIDLLDYERMAAGPGDRSRHLSVAITDAETAQMRAVKGLTWGSK